MPVNPIVIPVPAGNWTGFQLAQYISTYVPLDSTEPVFSSYAEITYILSTNRFQLRGKTTRTFNNDINLYRVTNYHLRLDVLSEDNEVLYEEMGFDEEIIQTTYTREIISPNNAGFNNGRVVFLRTSTFGVNSHVPGWENRDEGILGRFVIDVPYGSMFYYEPQSVVSTTFRNGTISEVQLEILDEDGDVLDAMEIDWQVTLLIEVSRGDTLSSAPTSYNNPLAMAATNTSMIRPPDFLQRRFDYA